MTKIDVRSAMIGGALMAAAEHNLGDDEIISFVKGMIGDTDFEVPTDEELDEVIMAIGDQSRKGMARALVRRRGQ